jgi:hypothetical protein
MLRIRKNTLPLTHNFHRNLNHSEIKIRMKIRKHKVTAQKQSIIGSLTVVTALCGLYGVAFLLISPPHFANQYSTNEISTIEQQILNTNIKILSQLCATKNEMIMPEDRIESLINESASSSSSRTYVKLFNKITTGQERHSETNPRVLLPP